MYNLNKEFLLAATYVCANRKAFSQKLSPHQLFRKMFECEQTLNETTAVFLRVK